MEARRAKIAEDISRPLESKAVGLMAVLAARAVLGGATAVHAKAALPTAAGVAMTRTTAKRAGPRPRSHTVVGAPGLPQAELAIWLAAYAPEDV